MNDYDNYFEANMKFINIGKKVSIIATICEQCVNITLDQKHNWASFTTVNENKQKQHWNVYRHPVDDMIFVVLMGVGNNEDDMSTWERFSESAGWARCAYDFSEIDEYGQDAIDDILLAIEVATNSIMKDLKLKKTVSMLK